MRLRTLSIAAAATLWLAAAIPISAQNSRWGANYFPNVPLVTQDGATVHFYDDLLKGKIVAINLIYTTCKYACPLETARLAQVQRELADRMGKDVFFYSITIDPEHDTPAVMKEYAEKFHAGPGWLFLTGKQEDIDKIQKKIGLYSAPDPSNPDGHTPNLLVGNEATGQWMRNSGVDNPKFLARTIGDWLSSWQKRRTDVTPTSYADAPRMTLDRGEYTFLNHCAACHTVGQGDRIGPDLAGVTAKRDTEWLKKFILRPDLVLASGDPIAKDLFKKYKNVPMPNLALSQDDASVLMEFLSRPPGTKAATPAPVEPHGSYSTVPPKPGASVAAVVEPYLRIQEALAGDTIAGVKDAATAVSAEADKLGTAGSSIESLSAELARTTDLKSARESFGRLGDAIITYAKASKAPLGSDVSVAYCPMLKKYWLQKGTKIQNPYYGKSMLECGRITQGLPDVAD